MHYYYMHNIICPFYIAKRNRKRFLTSQRRHDKKGTMYTVLLSFSREELDLKETCILCVCVCVCVFCSQSFCDL